MTTVLTLAYHFPPIGGAGVQRTVQLTRRLPGLGLRQILITGPGSVDYRWTPKDTGLVVSPADVHRIDAPQPAEPGPWRGRAERWLGIEQRWRRWWRDGVLRTGLRVGGSADVVHASVAPYQSAETAVELARRLGKPLVLDLEDPWALDEMLVYPTHLHRRLELRRMGRVLADADAVVMNTSEAAGRVRRAFPALDGARVVAIPNGYDPADFAAPEPPRGGTAFRIVHTGSLHTDIGLALRRVSAARRALGGHVPGADLLARSHVFLLEALDRLASSRPDLASRIELHLAGVLTAQDTRLVEGRSLVRLHGFLPHAETIELIRSADLLFLPLYDLPPGRRAGIVPHKTYEYVASGRPILAAVPEGDARDLLVAAGTARVCRPTDVDAMVEAVTAEMQRRDAGRASPTVPGELLARLGADRMAEAMAGLLHRVARASTSAAPVTLVA